MDPDTRDQPPTGRTEPKRLHLRRPGTCAACGISLAVGVEAFWDADARSVRCIDCPVDPAGSPTDDGVAGGSAQREHDRLKAARETRTKDRFGHRLGGVLLALTDEPASTRAWARGATGERELAGALENVEGLRVLHDRRVPGTRGNIDHLLVGSAGVFVVDAKRYEGLIRVRDVGGLFTTDERLYVGHRDCSKLAENMGWQIDAVTRALRAEEPLPPITPVLCFVKGEWPLLRPPSSYRGVRLESERSIRKLVTRSQVLDDGGIERLVHLLGSAFPVK